MTDMTLVRLTEKQKKLVDTLVANGGSVKNASQVAGYSEGESGRVSASKALKTPHVQQYMMQAISESMGMNATKALNKIVQLSSNAKSEYVSLEASKDILDRAGFKAPDKVMHSHVGNVNVKIDLS
jgi:phage terminase small subunit